MNQATSTSERFHIGVFGRTNVGKSSIINYISKQNVSIVSEIKGTTTDVVEKTMELSPLGPVVLFDTAGLDDDSNLGKERRRKAENTFRKCDYALLVAEVNEWGDFEESLAKKLNENGIKFAVIINKIDLSEASEWFIKRVKSISNHYFLISTFTTSRNEFVDALTSLIQRERADFFNDNDTILSGIVGEGDICVLIMPIDSGAPKGRIILPQVQAVRDALDRNAISVVVQVQEYPQVLTLLNQRPKIVITDSQAIKEVLELSPQDQPVTTFSICLARQKGDFVYEAKSAATLGKLGINNTILIAEACSHHSQKDDIARIKFPRLLNQYLNFKVNIEYSNGKDFPDDLAKYALVIHCGGCMITATEKRNRIRHCKNIGIPLTNFGMALAFLNGSLNRVLEPFNVVG